VYFLVALKKPTNDERKTPTQTAEPAPEADAPRGNEPSGTATPPSERPAGLSPQQIEELKTKAAKADEHWDRLVRLSADFDNFKKRAARERQDAIKFANEALLEKLIPALDNLDMALAAANDQQTATLESLRAGIAMIYNQLKGALTEGGLEELNATGKQFDPSWQEAVSHQETAAVPEGGVLQQLRKGYKLRDRLIRPATVIVAKKPAV